MRIAAVLSLSLLGAACADETSLYVPSPPPVPGATTLVLFIESSGEEDILAAVVSLRDGAQEDAVFFEVPNGDLPDPYTVRAAYYEASIDALDVRAGRLDTPSQPRACSFQRPMVMQQAVVFRDGTARWSTVTAALTSSENAHVQGGFDCLRPNLCQDFRVESFEIDSDNTVGVIVADGSSRALVGATDGTYHWVTREEINPAPAFEGAPARASYLQADGTLWLGGNNGRLTRGTLADPGEIVTTPVGREQIIAIGGWEGTELILVTQPSTEDDEPDHVKVYYQPPQGDWRLVAERMDDSVSSDQAQVVFTRAGRALIIYGGSAVFVLDGGVADPVFPDTLLPFGVEYVGLVNSLAHGVRLTANTGFLYAPTDDDYLGWAKENEAMIGINVASLLDYGNGFLFGGDNGTLGQYFPEGRSCEQRVVGSMDVEHLVLVGEDVLLGGDNNENPAFNRVVWLLAQ